MDNKIFYGETICQGIIKSTNKPCTNYAYYLDNKKNLCGVHSNKTTRKNLPKNPNKEKDRLEMYSKQKLEVERVAKENRNNGKKGKVILTKLKMMKQPEYVKGYLNVFPNFKHQNRKDGYGCMRLSPKSLGPIKHGMKNLPEAKNLENFHQFAKFWDFEFDEKDELKKEYLDKRKEGYENKEPFRHKYSKEILKKYNKNINVSKCSIYYDKDGGEHRYSYLECRYFYCHYYEKLAMKEPDFDKLMKYINDGYNLNIIGYDSYQVTQDLWKCYNDTSKSFGHELVLYTLLVSGKDEEYPWNRYYRENLEKYKGVI